VTDLYIGIKWVHIVCACIAFGSNVTHFFWILGANATADAVQRSNILRLVKKIDDRLAVPAYSVMVAAGATMWLWQWPLYSSWIIASLVLTTILTVMGICFGPFMKRWIRMTGEGATGNDSIRLPGLTRALTIWWGGIALTVPFILYFMVWKPVVW
jgi:uncharacterized membrane protein